MTAPFGRLEGRPLGLVNPSDLTAAEMIALRNVGSYRLRRGRGGYGRAGCPRVSLVIAQSLVGKGLVRVDLSELHLTGSGRWTLQIAEERQKRRRV